MEEVIYSTWKGPGKVSKKSQTWAPLCPLGLIQDTTLEEGREIGKLYDPL
jgi:hypothetical protein